MKLLKIITASVVLMMGIGGVRGDDVIIIEEPSGLGTILGEPTIGGNGCPQGSVSLTLGEEAKTLAINFEEYAVELWGRRKLDRKSCQLAIPVHLPKGLTVSLVALDYSGYNYLPDGATTTLTTETFFAGTQGEKLATDFVGALDDSFHVNQTVGLDNAISSECKQDVILRVNSSLKARGNEYGDYLYSAVDSLNASGGIVYRLRFAKCL